MNIEQITEALAEALRGAGVEVGYVGGETFRAHVADALAPLVARWLTEAKAGAWDEGYGDDATCNVPRENPYRQQLAEGVGTGAGEGAPRQDTGSAWVTRSEDCPEAPAQAHPFRAEASGQEGA